MTSGLSIRFYMDAQVQRAITEGISRRGIDVITAQEDGCDAIPDELLLARATHLGRIVVTQDQDFLSITARHLRDGVGFMGVVYGHHRQVGIGKFVEDLETIAQTTALSEWVNRLEYLPL